MTFLKQIDGRWQGRGNASPRDFFQSAEPGVYFDFSAPAGLYQDHTGTTPLAAPDQWMKLAVDRSRNRSPITVAAALQANTGLSPKWGRAPVSKRNRSSKTEPALVDLSLGTGVSNAVTPIAGFSASLQVPGGAVGNRIIYRDFGALANVQCILSFYVQMDDGLAPVVGNATPALNDFVIIIGNSAASGVYGPVVAVGGGVYRVSMYRTPSGTLQNTGLLKQDTNSARGFRVTGFQLELGTTVTALQVAANAFDLTEAGVPSYGFARLGLDDDVLSATLPAAQTGDVLVFGRSGSWIESNVTYGSGSTWSIGVTTVTGLPAGLLTAIGDIVGIIAIGRTLTATERNMALAYHKARGAAGWLVAGSNLWLDSGFDVNTGAAWTINGDGSYSAAGGAGTLGYSGAISGVVIGRAYLAEFEVTARTSGSVILPYDGSLGTQFTHTTTGLKRAIWRANNVYGPVIYSSSFNGTVRAVSLKPLVAA